MGADLYESYCGSILATAALGVAAAFGIGADVKGQLAMLAAPMVLAGVGIILSILGIYMVRTHEGASMKQLMNSLMRGVVGSSVLISGSGVGRLLAAAERHRWRVVGRYLVSHRCRYGRRFADRLGDGILHQL
jgi:K(+)-stimulated pyrophosphate-energized sodium pump